MENEKLEEIIAEKPAGALPEQDEIKKKEEQKANLDKAIAEANDELKRKRQALKDNKPEEDDLPKIDLKDPSAQAWDRRIQESTATVTTQLDRQKEEVRTFALRRFLSDKPSLARNPEKLKELMSNYERIKTATEQTQEGVVMDLEKAYGATFHEELVSAARNARLDAAKEEMIASDIGISRGSNSESSPPPQKRKLSAEEAQIVAQWESHGAPKID